MAEFQDGDRVRDTRSGAVGTVRYLDLTPEEKASGEYETAEVVWDGCAFQSGVSADEKHLRHLQ